MRCCSFVLLGTFCLVLCINGQKQSDVNDHNDYTSESEQVKENNTNDGGEEDIQELTDIQYVRKWQEAGQLVDKYAWPLKEVFSHLLTNILHHQVNVSDSCRLSLASYERSLRRGEYEALLLFDSFSTSQAGWLTDRIHSFGRYEQCLQSTFLSVPSRYALIQLHWPHLVNTSSQLTNRLSSDHVTGQTDRWMIHFSRHSDHFEMIPQLIAICIPSQCSEDDLNEVTHFISKQSNLVTVTVHSTQSKIEDAHSWYEGSFIQLTSRALLIIFVCWLLIASLLCYRKPSMSNKLLVGSFYLKKNLTDLFDLTSDISSSTNFISGCKGIYLLTGIYSHLSLPLEDSLVYFFLPIHSRMQSDAIWNVTSRYFTGYSGIVSISGLLQALSWFKQRQVPSFGIYIWKRALRTLPMTLIRLLIIFSFPLVYHSGPLTSSMQNSILKKCLKTSWMELFFISNWHPFHLQCFSVAWFISADLQLYALSFVSLFVLTKYPRVGLSLLTIQIAIGITAESYVINKFDIKPAVTMLSIPRLTQLSDALYLGHTSTHNYIASYSLGIIFGYLMHKKVKLSYFFVIISVIITSIPFITVALMYKQSLECVIPRQIEIIISSFVRLGACNVVGLGFLVFLTLPNTHIARIILSNKILLLLNRLSFASFMVHPFIIFYTQVTRLDTDYSFLFECMQFIFITLVSVFIGILVKISVEMPFDLIVKGFYHIKKDTNKNN